MNVKGQQIIQPLCPCHRHELSEGLNQIANYLNQILNQIANNKNITPVILLLAGPQGNSFYLCKYSSMWKHLEPNYMQLQLYAVVGTGKGNNAQFNTYRNYPQNSHP